MTACRWKEGTGSRPIGTDLDQRSHVPVVLGAAHRAWPENAALEIPRASATGQSL